MDKESILSAIKQLAKEGGGTAPGMARFEQETGIGVSVWRGKYWARWSDAVVEAGFTPNSPNDEIPKDVTLEKLATLALRIGHMPTYGEVRMTRQSDETFPAHQTIQRLGSKEERVELLRQLALRDKRFEPLLQLLPEGVAAPSGADNQEADGFVYLAKMGKHYKIGKTFSVPRRHREIALQLPESLTAVHAIRTDDPSGIEAYWHRRFESLRTNGEWFLLTLREVRAFKKRKFM